MTMISWGYDFSVRKPMSTRVAVLRERFLSNSEITNFQVGSDYEISAFGAKGRNQEVDIPIYNLYSSASISGPHLSKGAQAIQSLLFGSSTYMFGLVDELADFDIVHTIETFQGFSEQAVKAKQKHGCKVVCTVFENIPHFSESSHYSNTWKETLKHKDSDRIKNKVRNGTDIFLAASDQAKTALEIEGVDSDRIRIIPLGVDINTFHPDYELGGKDDLPGYLSRGNHLNVVFVGRYTWEKGIFDLLAAWKDVNNITKCTAKLTLVGEGPARDSIEAFIKSKSVPNVALCGPVDYGRVPLIFNSADITVVPSLPTRFWQEQFGRVITESQACGTPVIASETGGVPYAMGEHGILAQPGDPHDWSQKIRLLLNDKERRDEIARDARSFVEENRDRQDVRDQVRNVYRSLS